MVQLAAHYGYKFRQDPLDFLGSDMYDLIIRSACLQIILRSEAKQNQNGTITDDVNDLS